MTVAALESQLYQLAAKKSKMEARIAYLKTEGEALPTGITKGAGYKFGGRFEKSNNKNH